MSLIDAFAKKGDKTAEKQAKKPNGNTKPADAAKRFRKYAEAQLASRCANLAATAEGQRNHLLNVHAYQMAGMVARGWIGETAVKNDLAAAAKRAGLDENEIGVTLASGFDDGVTVPAEDPPDQPKANNSNGGAYHDGTPKGDYAKQQMKPKFAFIELGDLTTLVKQEWLCFDARTDKPLLLAHKIMILSADGGGGKSYFYLMFAVCIGVASYIDPLFGLFRFERHGHVFVFTAEDDEIECHNRLVKIANSLHLSDTQRDKIKQYVHVCPLEGIDCTLLETDRFGNCTETQTYSDMLAFLKQTAKDGGFEWVFGVIDPFARFAGEAETSNAIATRLNGMLQQIIKDLPGNPGLGISHHASQSSVNSGDAKSRGVTGNRNAVRAEFTITLFVTDDGLEGLLLANGKNNCSKRADPLWLVRCLNEPLKTGGQHLRGCTTGRRRPRIRTTGRQARRATSGDQIGTQGK